MKAASPWHGRPEGGGRFAIWLIRCIALYGGRRLARACLYPITGYFYLRRGSERRASRDYLGRVFGRAPTRWQVLRHVHCFSATILDRVFWLAQGERPFAIETQGLEQLEQLVARGQGVLLLGSHQGSFEALRTISSRRPGLALRVVLDKQQTPALTALLEALAPGVGASVIDAAQGGPCMALAMAEACASGALVALLADRGREREVLRRAELLGAPAPFPTSPWLLANSLRVPVVLCFGLYLGGNRYRLVFEPFAERVEIPRRGRDTALDALIARYAQRLEYYMRVAPYNWFNFYDFWQANPAPAEAPAAVAADSGPAAAGLGDRASA
ncbi:MAG: acyltransferase [Xanthomonadales bacterium]|nr:acyltransferase [Xanthomonadales bacterium]